MNGYGSNVMAEKLCLGWRGSLYGAGHHTPLNSVARVPIGSPNSFDVTYTLRDLTAMPSAGLYTSETSIGLMATRLGG